MAAMREAAKSSVILQATRRVKCGVVQCAVGRKNASASRDTRFQISWPNFSAA
ncbi:hypothetical protein CEV34_3222 [Brucella pseudogrignonensis]|uniref:Uncharacterized protein n=1 Tax=Brucella pseudogrignonensis TaxID=419475 RepID=A0A256G9V6_9HYPH|nr:hypothetical protein CEV34_3222 [Brucella pseudogrignonensis]